MSHAQLSRGLAAGLSLFRIHRGICRYFNVEDESGRILRGENSVSL
jgi:hypothetical protein